MRHAFLKDLAKWERSKKGKVYPAGSICLQVSASKGELAMLEEAGGVDSKYCVIEPAQDVLPEYLFIVMEMNMDEFRAKHQTGLNIVPDTLNFFEFDMHEKIEEQEKVVSAMKMVQRRIEEEERIVRQLQSMKQFHLGMMFPN